MATVAQIAANRENSQSSTGPKTEEGKSRIARNAVTLGLFTMNDFVLPEEAAEHKDFCHRFWTELKPAGPVEETFAGEMIRAAWRLRRCGIIEAGLAQSPEQNEANSRAQNAVDRARAQANHIFRRAHNDLRRLQADHAPDAQPVPPPRDGFGFSNPPATAPPVPTAPAAPANQTQFIPRSAPCPCASGEKYKRCCGRNAPGLLHRDA